jgi:N-acetylmuramoyl-L-alanine amidase
MRHPEMGSGRFVFNSSALWRGLGLAAWLLIALVSPGFAQALPDVLAARVTSTPERARLIIDLSSTTEFAIVSLTGPNRIAVDVRAKAVSMTTAPAVAGTGMVTAFSSAMAAEGRARTELVLSSAAVVQQAYMLDAIDDQPARLVVDLIPTSADDFNARAAQDLANSLARETTPPEQAADNQAAISSEPPALTSTEPPAVEPASRPLVVIDPGHGGFDSGAEAGSIREKDITLIFALRLRDTLVGSGKFDVALTRDDDTYLTLNQRVDLARENKADLFISLHADTFQEPTIRGASVYTRDERATDVLDAVLAEGENRRDVVSGFLPAEAKPAVADILLDLMRRQVRRQAYLAAAAMVQAMQPSIALRRFPVRQADFFVLQAPDVPSLLVELGFLSNAKDITNLESDAWRDQVVAALAKGIGDYFEAGGGIR